MNAALVMNIVAFNAGWFAAVLGAAYGHPWLGVAIVLALALIQTKPETRARELSLLTLVAITGVVIDSFLAYFQVLRFGGEDPAIGLSTVWMMALWINYGTTLDRCLAWLRNRVPLAVVAGAISGPLAYYGGVEFGALEFGRPVGVSLIAVGAAYAIAVPVTAQLAERALAPSRPN